MKSVFISIGLTTVTSATDAVFQKEIYGSGVTTVIISNDEMKSIIEIIKYLEE